MAKQKLGRGFDALIPKDLDKSILQEDSHRVQKLLIQDIVPNSEQPRREWDESALKELSASIKRHGVLQPIIVVRRGNNYQIVAGERRWRAAQSAGLKQVPAIVRSLEELEQIELALIENIQRVDLSPLEQAMAIYKLQHQFSLALEQIAEKLGKAPSTVSNLARLLQLPENAHQALESGKITEGHARAILALRQQPTKQAELLRSILDNKWTVRQAEQFARNSLSSVKSKSSLSLVEDENKVVDLLSKKLKLPVKINHLARGGRVQIEYKNIDELHSIVQNLNLDN